MELNKLIYFLLTKLGYKSILTLLKENGVINLFIIKNSYSYLPISKIN